MKKNWPGEQVQRYHHNTHTAFIFPLLRNFEQIAYHTEKHENRRLRVLVRALKIGGKRSGAGSGMAVFEMKKK